MSERTILYLNVNGFLGKQEKKEIYKIPESNQNEIIYKAINEARENIREETVTTFHKELAKKMIDYVKSTDMIFLSEVDPRSSATSGFIDQINKINRENTNEEYDVLTPSAGYKYSVLEDIPGCYYSCTICLKKKYLKNYTNVGNGFKTKGKYEDKDYLQICKIINEKVVLLAIHAKDEEEFNNSIRRLLNYARENNLKIIVFGDTNANPDAKIEDKKEAFARNRRFEHLMNELGLHEIVPKKKLATCKERTRIDRVFTNMPKDKVTVDVDQTFLDNNLSDHAALLITYEED